MSGRLDEGVRLAGGLRSLRFAAALYAVLALACPGGEPPAARAPGEV